MQNGWPHLKFGQPSKISGYVLYFHLVVGGFDFNHLAGFNEQYSLTDIGHTVGSALQGSSCQCSWNSASLR